MAIPVNFKRVFVVVLAIALLAVSIAGIFHTMDIFSVIVDALVIIGAIGGIIGAYRMDVRHLAWFFWSLVLLLVLQAVFVIYNWLHWHNHDDALHYTTYNFVTIALLVLGAIATWDLERCAGSHDPMHESLV